MNVLINSNWYYAIEAEDSKIGVEIPEGEISVYNEIFDNSHKTHGKAILLNIAYAYLHQEPNGKGKVASKCKVGHYTNCLLEHITPNYHKGLAYAFFKYEQNTES